MAKVFPGTIKQPFEQLPLGVLQWEIADAMENLIGNDNPKYGVQVSLAVVAPEEAAGLTHTENFIFGTDEDPGDLQNGVAEETFEKRAGRFDQFCQKAGEQGIDIRGQAIDQVCAMLKGQQIKSINEAKREPAFIQWGQKKGQANPYAGRYRVNPRWLALEEGGEVKITGNVADLEAADASQGAAPAAAPAPAPAPVQRAAAPMPPAQRTAAPAAAPAARPAAAPAPRPAAPAARRVGR
jgi:hypothetical protein